MVSVAAWRPALKRKRKRKRARTFDQEEIPVEQQEKVMEPPRKRVTFGRSVFIFGKNLSELTKVFAAADLIEAGSSRVQETLTNVLDGSQPDTHQAAPVQRTGLSPNSVRGEVPLSRSAGIVLESRPRPRK